MLFRLSAAGCCSFLLTTHSAEFARRRGERKHSALHTRSYTHTQRTTEPTISTDHDLSTTASTSRLNRRSARTRSKTNGRKSNARFVEPNTTSSCCCLRAPLLTAGSSRSLVAMCSCLLLVCCAPSLSLSLTIALSAGLFLTPFASSIPAPGEITHLVAGLFRRMVPQMWWCDRETYHCVFYDASLYSQPTMENGFASLSLSLSLLAVYALLCFATLRSLRFSSLLLLLRSNGRSMNYALCLPFSPG